MVSIELQPAHGVIILLSVLLGFINSWMAFGVGAARKKYGVLYPQMYAEPTHKNAKAFNCVQRAHQNTLENIPIFLMLFWFGAIYRPQIAAIAGLIRILGFVVYFKCYSQGDPKLRLRGAFGYLGLFALIGLSIEAGIRIAMA